jgi:recombination protein RecA
VAPPFKKVEIDILFGKGISATTSLIGAALKYDLIQKSGSWYSFGDERIGQGRDSVQKFLEENPTIATNLDEKLRMKMFPEKYGVKENIQPQVNSSEPKNNPD